MDQLQIIGRSSSHFTRVPLIFAHELGVAFEFVPILDMTPIDSGVYAGNPALKMPTMRRDGSLVFGAENICRVLAGVAAPPRHVVWPEHLGELTARNAQELVWHGMSAQVQLVFGISVSKLPADNLYFVKARAGFEGALRWLNDKLADVLRTLPASRDISLFEVTLFCLIEHLRFRPTVPTEPYPSLTRFAQAFAARPAARSTVYRFDTPPREPAETGR